MRTLGLDLSITGSGCIILESDLTIVTAMLVTTTPQCGNDMVRFALTTACIRDIVRRHKPRLAVIENYAYDKPSGVARMAELGGQVKGMLWRNHVDYICIPPSSLKLYATGRGNASKDDMVAAAQDLIPDLIQPDIADALACARWGVEHGDDFPGA